MSRVWRVRILGIGGKQRAVEVVGGAIALGAAGRRRPCGRAGGRGGLGGGAHSVVVGGPRLGVFPGGGLGSGFGVETGGPVASELGGLV